MALAHRLTSTGTGATNPSISSFSAVAGDLLVAFIDFTAASGVTSPGVSDPTAGAWSLVESFVANTTHRIAMFVRPQIVAATGSLNITSSATYTGGSTSSALAVSAFSGATIGGLNAVVQTKTGTGAASSTPSASFDAAASTGNVTVGMVSGQSASSVTAPTNWTERCDVARTSVGVEVATRDSGFTGTTITWGATVTNAHGVIIAELQAALTVGASESGSASSASDASFTIPASDAESGTASESTTGEFPNSVSQTNTASASESVQLATGVQQIERGRNLLPNGKGVGATVGTIGSGGVAPSDWIRTPANGISCDVVAFSNTAGTVDLRFYGTASAFHGIETYFNGTTSTPFFDGNSYTQSVGIALIAGSFANVDELRFSHSIRLAGGGSSTGGVGTDFKAAVPASGHLRFMRTFAPSDANGVYIMSSVQAVVQSGAAIDFTLRFTLPMLEAEGVQAGSPVPTSGTLISQTISHSSAATAVFVGAGGASASAADSPGAVYAPSVVAQTETGAASDSPVGNWTTPVSRSESGAAADAPSVLAAFASTGGESASASATQSVVTTFVSAGGESASAADSPGAVYAPSVVAQTEAGAASDSPAGASFTPVSEAESATAAESVASSAAFAVANTNAGSAADTRTVIATQNLTVLEEHKNWIESVAAGAVVGAPGTPPTGWGFPATSGGLSREIVWVDAVGGEVEIRYSGTSDGNGFNCPFMSSNVAPAEFGQNWTLTGNVRRVAGSLVNVSAVNAKMFEVASDGSTVLVGASFANFVANPSFSDGDTYSLNFSRNNTSTAVAYVQAAIFWDFDPGPVDFTIRYTIIQLERTGHNNPIVTSGVPSTRTKDALTTSVTVVGSESTSASNVQSAVQTQPASVAESVTASEQTAATAQFVVSITNVGSAVEVSAGGLVFTVARSESAPITTSDTTQITVPTVEVVSAAAVQAATLAMPVAGTSAGAASDASSAVAQFVAASTNVGSAADAPSANYAPAVVTITNSAVATDVPVGSFLFVRSASDSAAPSDAASAIRGQYSAQTNVGVPMDVLALAVGYAVSRSEAANVSAVGSVTAAFVAAALEQMTASVATPAVVTFVGASADVLTAGSTSSALVTFAAQIASSTAVAVAHSAALTTPQQSQNSASAAEVGAASSVVTRSAEDVLSAAQTADATAQFVASSANAGAASDASSVSRTTFGSISEVALANDVQSVLATMFGGQVESADAAVLQRVVTTFVSTVLENAAPTATITNTTSFALHQAEANLITAMQAASAVWGSTITESGSSAEQAGASATFSVDQLNQAIADVSHAALALYQALGLESGSAVDASDAERRLTSSSDESAPATSTADVERTVTGSLIEQVFANALAKFRKRASFS